MLTLRLLGIAAFAVSSKEMRRLVRKYLETACRVLYTGTSGPSADFASYEENSPHCVARWASKLQRLVVVSERKLGFFIHLSAAVEKNAATLQQIEIGTEGQSEVNVDHLAPLLFLIPDCE